MTFNPATLGKAQLDEFSHLDERYKFIYKEGKEYPVGLSPRLKSLQDQVVREAQDWVES